MAARLRQSLGARCSRKSKVKRYKRVIILKRLHYGTHYKIIIVACRCPRSVPVQPLRLATINLKRCRHHPKVSNSHAFPTQYANYKTLVLAKLAGKRLLRLITKFSGELACRHRRFEVSFYNSDIASTAHIRCTELTTGTQRRIGYEIGNQPSLVAACRKLVEVIGPHDIAKLNVPESIWNRPEASAIFEGAVLLKYAGEVVLSSDRKVLPICDRNYVTSNPLRLAFMSNFAGVYSRQLWPYFRAHRQVVWTFRLVS